MIKGILMKIETTALVQNIRETIKGKTGEREQVVTFAIEMSGRTIMLDFNFPSGTIGREQLWKTWDMTLSPKKA